MATVENGYPLDPTGISSTNKATGELHIFTSTKGRVFALNYGAFFAPSLVLHDKVSGKTLTNDQYFAAYRLDFPSAQYNNEICAVIVITDENVGLQVTVDYQALGGIYSYAGDNLATVLRKALSANRSIYWPPLIVPHDQEPDNQYKLWPGNRIGFEYATMAIARLKEAMRYGDIASYEAVGKYAITQSAGIAQLAKSLLDGQLASHVQQNEPHPQYMRRDALDAYLPWVKQPTNMAPVPGSPLVPLTGQVLSGSAYRGLYGIAQAAAQFQLATNPTMDNPTVITVGTAIQATINNPLSPNTTYYWQVRYQNAEGAWSIWSKPSNFTTANA
jgi:hypothetical protein